MGKKSPMTNSILIALLIGASSPGLPIGEMKAPRPMAPEALEVVAAAYNGIYPAPKDSACVLSVSSSGNFEYFDLLWTLELVGYLGPLPPSAEANPLKNDIAVRDPELYDRINKDFLSFRESHSLYHPTEYTDISALSKKLPLASATDECREIISFSTPLISKNFAFILVDRTEKGKKDPKVTTIVLSRSNDSWTAIGAHGF